MIYIFSTDTFDLVKVDCTMDELEKRASDLLEKDMTVDDEFSNFLNDNDLVLYGEDDIRTELLENVI